MMCCSTQLIDDLLGRLQRLSVDVDPGSRTPRRWHLSALSHDSVATQHVRPCIGDASASHDDGRSGLAGSTRHPSGARRHGGRFRCTRRGLGQVVACCDLLLAILRPALTYLGRPAVFATAVRTLNRHFSDHTETSTRPHTCSIRDADRPTATSITGSGPKPQAFAHDVRTPPASRSRP